MTDPVQTSSPPIGKEVEGGISLGEPFPLKDIGTHEQELPKEVIAVGVSPQPTNIPLPQTVQQLGVRPSGATQPMPQPVASSVPLTDEAVAEGLKQGITSSWLWLAQWCVRKIKQLRRTISSHA